MSVTTEESMTNDSGISPESEGMTEEEAKEILKTCLLCDGKFNPNCISPACAIVEAYLRGLADARRENDAERRWAEGLVLICVEILERRAIQSGKKTWVIKDGLEEVAADLVPSELTVSLEQTLSQYQERSDNLDKKCQHTKFNADCPFCAFKFADTKPRPLSKAETDYGASLEGEAEKELGDADPGRGGELFNGEVKW